MFARCVFLLTFLAMTTSGQYFPGYGQYPINGGSNHKGVCTINGQAYYGFDCWCYSNVVGSTFLTISFFTLLTLFFVNGCLWACIFRCHQKMFGRKEEDYEADVGSVRSSVRSMRKASPETNF
ncbi:CLUMA_CG008722, isoform A [Clunio marinus]|uniref:CLUMA_CG008722, isoform A n=1 Tax=Clunio marinus TaxID=568069 RepID=A0A1J1I6R0_9DIPT|nr:CLUMA_CG008722, isoform A [Clunio marinus]